MKKLLLIVFLLIPFNAISAEKTKEEKVAKYVLENIQKDYVACYTFYKITAESFKKAGKDKQIIDGLEKGEDLKLKSVLNNTEGVSILSNCEKIIKYKLES